MPGVGVRVLEAYFRDLLEIRSSGAGVQETSFYPALVNLLDNIGKPLKPRVRCILQLANRGAGHPDGGLFTEEQLKQADQQKPLLGQKPSRGAIEVKPAGDNAWVTAESQQVTDYWRVYRQVLVTNYRDFVLVGQDQDGNPVKLETYRLAETEDSFWAQTAHPRRFAGEHEAAFTEFLHRVMLHAAHWPHRRTLPGSWPRMHAPPWAESRGRSCQLLQPSARPLRRPWG